jgi:hypothetical protein
MPSGLMTGDCSLSCLGDTDKLRYCLKRKFGVQAINDFVIFTVAGVGSLLSGVIYSSLGWDMLIYISAAMVRFCNMI